jgi:hypothetical protein
MATSEWLADQFEEQRAQIANGRIGEMNILADPDRLSRLDLSAIER